MPGGVSLGEGGLGKRDEGGRGLSAARSSVSILWVWGRFEGGFFTVPRHTTRPTPEPPIRSYRVEMPPKKKRVAVKPRDAAKMPRNPAEDALYRLTLAGDLFKEQVLARLDPTERGMLRLVNKDLRHAVHRSDLRWTFMVPVFVESVERFEWALKHKILESSHWCLSYQYRYHRGRQLGCAEACGACYSCMFSRLYIHIY